MLVVVHTVVGGLRLLAATRAVESEPGVQVVFTPLPGATGNRVAEFLATTGALVIPWQRAAHGLFDLVVAASPIGIGTLRGPLLLLPEVSIDGEIVDHNGERCIPALSRLHRQRTGCCSGTIVVGLPHGSASDTLQATSPDIARHAVLVGDPEYDHLLDTLHHRRIHRDRLGVCGDKRLGLVVSTGGPGSLLGRSPALLKRLAADLPERGDQLICHLHPDVWLRHGRRQVLAWAGPLVRERVRFLRLGQSWQIPIAAADYVVGDCGAVTAYAASVGKPVYLANPLPTITTNSLGDALARYATVLDPVVPLTAQFDWTARPSAPVVGRITSVPRRFAELARAECFRLLRITDSTQQAVTNH